MVIRSLLTFFNLLCAALLIAQTTIDPEQYKVIGTDRLDGRYVSSRGFVQHLIRNAPVQLAFNPQCSAEEFKIWQNKVRVKMEELMQFPEVPPQPQPKLLESSKRNGYTVEKWEIYPQPGSIVPILMLIPDDISSNNPGAAVLCFPGSNRTKENLAGEEELNPKYAVERHDDKNRMAMFYAQQGIVAVAVDNPGVGEASDLEKYGLAPGYERNSFSRYLIDMGWSYLGLSAFQGHQILKWMRSRDLIDNKRIALSGHSLGTEPVIALAVLNPDIKAVVVNDFLCRTITRTTVVTKPTERGLRPGANWLGHCVPGLWRWFDLPDIIASIAPRPLILTEGGAQTDLDLIKEAYNIMDAKDNIAIYYYPKYSDPSSRLAYEFIPEGLDMEEYFRYVNVDAPNHYFKSEVAVPWLKDVLDKIR